MYDVPDMNRISGAMSENRYRNSPRIYVNKDKERSFNSKSKSPAILSEARTDAGWIRAAQKLRRAWNAATLGTLRTGVMFLRAQMRCIKAIEDSMLEITWAAVHSTECQGWWTYGEADRQGVYAHAGGVTQMG